MSAGAPGGEPAGPLGQAVDLAFTVLFVVVAALAAAWLLGGAVAVPAGDRGVIVRLGAIDREVPAGLAVALPRPFEEVVVVPGPERQLALDIADLRLADPERPRAGDGIDLRRDGGYALTADGSVAHLGLRAVYQVRSAAAYVRAGGRGGEPGERIAGALRRAAVAAAVAACAGRTLDGVMVAGGSADAAPSAAAARDRLRADLVAGANARLAQLDLGIEVVRIDATTALPARAQRAYDAVLAETQAADRRVAEAKGAAQRTVQAAQAQRAAIIGQAGSAARDLVVAAQSGVAQIQALAQETAPERRRLLLSGIYRERIEAVLRQAGAVAVVDGRQSVQLALPGDGR